MSSLPRVIYVVVTVCYSYIQLQRFRRLPAARRAASLEPKRFVERLLVSGPVFVKIGQMLSTRPDVMPAEYIVELQRLQERVPPMPFAEVKAVLHDAFPGRSTFDVFASFDELPVASASVAQVHFATFTDGQEVAVKIQRLGIEALIRRDLSALDAVIQAASVLVPKIARAFNVRAGFAEFRRYTLQELDFTVEAQTMLAFRKNFAGWRDVLIPEPFLTHVSRHVLTMERVSGKRVDVIVKSLSPERRIMLSRRLLEIEMKMFIADGLFHADLHPGNVFFKDDGTIVLLDFGMYGSLTTEHRDHFMLYWFYAVQKRTKMSFRHLIAQTQPLPDADEHAYYEYFRTLADRFYGTTISKYSLTQTYVEIIGGGARFGYVFPSDLLLQAKALTTAEALAFVLTPDLRFEDEAQPIIAREFAQRIADPSRIRRHLEDALPELLLFGKLPEEQSPEGEGDEQITARLWSSAGRALVEYLRAYSAEVSNFRTLIDPTAKRILSRAHGENGRAILEEIWADAKSRWETLPSQSTFGATTMVRLAAVTAAAYDTLVARGSSAQDATQTVYDIAWGIYKKMGGAAWTTSGFMSTDSVERLRLATLAFRTFPFSAPSYEWKTVPSPVGVVGFDCLKCPVADYFAKQNLSELCVRTWCALDFPLATDVWHAQLERTGSIAGGASRCDFRWTANPGV